MSTKSTVVCLPIYPSRKIPYSLWLCDQDERELFSQLISVSGVGPNTAQMILSSLTPHDIQQAISSNNVGLLQSVKGIGGKTAQRIILDLKDKIMKLDLSTNHEVSYNTTKEEALSALTMLGFSKGSIEKIIDKELQENPSQLVEEVVKKVLKKYNIFGALKWHRNSDIQRGY